MRCVENEKDGTEHTIFDCYRWDAERQILIAVIGGLTCFNVIYKILTDEVNWDAVIQFVRIVLTTKKEEKGLGGLNRNKTRRTKK